MRRRIQSAVEALWSWGSVQGTLCESTATRRLVPAFLLLGLGRWVAIASVVSCEHSLICSTCMKIGSVEASAIVLMEFEAWVGVPADTHPGGARGGGGGGGGGGKGGYLLPGRLRMQRLLCDALKSLIRNLAGPGCDDAGSTTSVSRSQACQPRNAVYQGCAAACGGRKPGQHEDKL